MYRDMEHWLSIRHKVLVEGVSKREVQRQTGLHWKTLEKILAHPQPPGYRRSKPAAARKIDPYLDQIKAILQSDKQMPRKQRHTAKRIWQVIAAKGFKGQYTIVKDAVRELKQGGGEVFMPLKHPPGEAQVDFGYALANVAGVLRKVAFLVVALPYSDALFVMAFDRECTETFWEGHVQAFAFFGGVPRRIAYDNTKVCISQITGARDRVLTDGFRRLMSHYLFKAHFCLVRRANEKGVVEGMVKFTRLNFFVPVPRVRDLDELNAHLLAQCRSDLARRLRGQSGTKQQLLDEEREAMRALPQTPFEACRVEPRAANSESLVRFDTNEYSVPVEYAHHDVTVKGYWDRVVICHRQQVVAEHRRCWARHQAVFEPVHYLPLLERKPGSLDYALPLAGWPLPDCFDTLRRRLEREQPDGQGRLEFIRVLRLLEKHSQKVLAAAVQKALAVRSHSRDAIAQFIPPPQAWGMTTFRLDGRDHLRHVKVRGNDPRVYAPLLGGEPAAAPIGGVR